MNVSQHVIVGRLARDPHVINNADPKRKLALFTLMVNRVYKGKDGNTVSVATAHPCQAWGKGADLAEKWLKKGKLIGVMAEFRNPGKRDEATGEYKSWPVFRVNRIEFGPDAKNSSGAAVVATSPAAHVANGSTTEQTLARITEIQAELQGLISGAVKV
jgi:single-stranded DNA-binding protein